MKMFEHITYVELSMIRSLVTKELYKRCRKYGINWAEWYNSNRQKVINNIEWGGMPLSDEFILAAIYYRIEETEKELKAALFPEPED